MLLQLSADRTLNSNALGRQGVSYSPSSIQLNFQPVPGEAARLQNWEWGFRPNEFPRMGVGARERVSFEGSSEKRFSSQLSDKMTPAIST